MIKSILSFIVVSLTATIALATHPISTSRSFAPGVYEITIAANMGNCVSEYELVQDFDILANGQVLNLSFGKEKQCEGPNCPRFEPQMEEGEPSLPSSTACQLGFSTASGIVTLSVGTYVNAVQSKFRLIIERKVLWEDRTDHIIGHQ